MPSAGANNHQIDRLRPYDDGEEVWYVVVETPKGSHNKYQFDPALGGFILKGVLPEGMSFPYDFGFLPSTLGEDGDPLDVLVLSDEPSFCGCIVPARLIGVIEAEQTERDGSCQRNDRLVAVPVKARTLSDCRSVKDLNEQRLREIQDFFISYNRVRGKRFRILGIRGASKAERIAHSGASTCRKHLRKRQEASTNGAKKK